MVVKIAETLNVISFDEINIMAKKTAFIVTVKLYQKKAFSKEFSAINVLLAANDLLIEKP